MYFLLIFQLVTADAGAWTQLGVYETQAQCETIAHIVRESTSIKYVCAPSKPEGKKV